MEAEVPLAKYWWKADCGPRLRLQPSLGGDSEYSKKDGGHTDIEPRMATYQAAIMVADISGFTPLTERPVWVSRNCRGDGKWGVEGDERAAAFESNATNTSSSSANANATATATTGAGSTTPPKPRIPTGPSVRVSVVPKATCYRELWVGAASRTATRNSRYGSFRCVHNYHHSYFKLVRVKV